MKRVCDWLDYVWDFVAAQLPAGPANVIEVGCGPHGGLVPRLTETGYRAVGVDPNAPDEPGYVQTEFEQYRVSSPADVIVASLSLHHVADLDIALDHLNALVRPGGTVVVVEWARERFDERTARWCFDRLPVPEHEDHAGWLHRFREDWPASGMTWPEFVDTWARADGVLRADRVLAGLDARLDRVGYAEVPYLFADLDGVTPADEQAAIDAGDISVTGVRYVGRAGN